MFTKHHLAHAASAFFPSPYAESAVLTIDGVGEWATASIRLGTGNQLKIIKEMKFPHSLGLLYSSRIFDDIWIQPAAGDAGGALGAALAVYHLYFNGSSDFLVQRY